MRRDADIRLHEAYPSFTILLLQAHSLRYSCGEALLSADVADVLRSLLHADPAQRVTARQLLRHPWLQKADHARHGRL